MIQENFEANQPQKSPRILRKPRVRLLPTLVTMIFKNATAKILAGKTVKYTVRDGKEGNAGFSKSVEPRFETTIRFLHKVSQLNDAFKATQAHRQACSHLFVIDRSLELVAKDQIDKTIRLIDEFPLKETDFMDFAEVHKDGN